MTQNSVTAQDTLVTADEVHTLQEDLIRPVDWANKWQMNFNVDQCAVMHIGHNKTTCNTTTYNTTTQPQVAETHQKSCKTRQKVLGFIARNFNYKSTEVMLPRYKSLVRPHLEYTVQFWSPHLCKDMEN